MGSFPNKPVILSWRSTIHGVKPAPFPLLGRRNASLSGTSSSLHFPRAQRLCFRPPFYPSSTHDDVCRRFHKPLFLEQATANQLHRYTNTGPEAHPSPVRSSSRSHAGPKRASKTPRGPETSREKHPFPSTWRPRSVSIHSHDLEGRPLVRGPTGMTMIYYVQEQAWICRRRAEQNSFYAPGERGQLSEWPAAARFERGWVPSKGLFLVPVYL